MTTHILSMKPVEALTLAVSLPLVVGMFAIIPAMMFGVTWGLLLLVGAIPLYIWVFCWASKKYLEESRKW